MGFDPGNNPLHVKTDNPYDLRPALNVAINEIKREYEALEEGQKLVVLFGELHNLTSHKAFQEMIASQMQQVGLNPLVALENAHNEINLNGHCLNLALAFNSGLVSRTSPYSNAFYYHQLWNKSISTAFVDVSKKQTVMGKVLINRADEKTNAFINETSPDLLSTNIDATLPYAIHIRNQFMLKEVFVKANTGGHNAIFLPTGGAHIFGDNYALSLHSLAHNQNYFEKFLSKDPDEPMPKVVTITPHYTYEVKGRKNNFEISLPLEAYPHVRNMVIPTAFSEDSFFRHDDDGSMEFKFEREILTRIYRTSGLISANEELPTFSDMHEEARQQVIFQCRQSLEPPPVSKR